jgi:hypothetical protein
MKLFLLILLIVVLLSQVPFSQKKSFYNFVFEIFSFSFIVCCGHVVLGQIRILLERRFF